jgi:hypothetical protein
MELCDRCRLVAKAGCLTVDKSIKSIPAIYGAEAYGLLNVVGIPIITSDSTRRLESNNTKAETLA